MEALNDQFVERQHWDEFCARFGAVHRGWQVTLAAQGESGLVLARDRALRGLRATGPQSLLIDLDGPSPQSFEFANVTRIAESFLDGRHAGLLIERDAGPAVRMAFRVPSLPETLLVDPILRTTGGQG